MVNPLFSIPLMGLGTAEVESLPSYLHRCAIAHGSDVGLFIQTVNRLVPDSNLCVTEQVKAKHFKPHELVRPGKLADSIIASLSSLSSSALTHEDHCDISLLYAPGEHCNMAACFSIFSGEL